MMSKDLQYAFELIQHENNQSIKNGEGILVKLRTHINYPLLLLSHVKNCNEYVGKLRAAIQLRIWCQGYQNMQEFERNTYTSIIEQVKNSILFTFLTASSEKIQQTILPGIVSLTVVEFPDRWGSLVPGLITYAKENQGAIKKVLQLMVEITNKYSYLTRTDPLFHQIIIVCDQFQQFLLTLTSHSVSNIIKIQNDVIQLKILQAQISLFYNLNYQDLHPQFEDNIQKWMNILKQVMQLPNNNQNFFRCKGVALQAILLYASKYKDDVQQQIKSFSESIWTLCAKASPDCQYDDIVFNALKYFRSLLMWQDMRQFFGQNIANLVSSLILPNLNFSKYYKELFQEDIQSFISYFFRNAEISSRRAAAIELLQTLVRNYKGFQQFIQEQIQGFTLSGDNVDGLYLLITLVIESASKGFRDVDGVTQLQVNNGIIEYTYKQFIRNSFNVIYQSCQQVQENDKKPIPIEKQMNILQLLVTLRFVFYFRIYLPTEQLNSILKLCCEIKTENQSLKEILLLVVDAIVTLKHGNFQLYKNIVYFYDEHKLKDVGQNVFGMIAEYQRSTLQLSISINKLLYSMVRQLKGFNDMFYSSQIEPIIKSMLHKTSTFNFACILPLFQALGYLSYYLCVIKTPTYQNLQQLTQQYFHQMIKSQSDILNFCFQILSIFLQFGSGEKEFYQRLYGSVIREENWTEDNVSIMSAYLQYIGGFIALNGDRIVKDKQHYEKILSKLISLDYYQLFYRLLRAIIRITGVQNFYNYGYMSILIRGSDFIAKTVQGRKLGLLFIFEMTYDFNAEVVIKYMNQAENGYYQRVLLGSQDIIQTMQVISNRKMMFSSICNALVKKCFSSVQNQAVIVGLLVDNTTGRFRRDYVINSHGDGVNKKEATYQKLTVFKEIENVNRNISLDEQNVLVQTYTILVKNDPSIYGMISEKNMQRLKKIYENQQKQSNYNEQNNFGRVALI